MDHWLGAVEEHFHPHLGVGKERSGEAESFGGDRIQIDIRRKRDATGVNLQDLRATGATVADISKDHA